MQKIYPEKLKSGDMVQIIAPASSLGIISQDCREIANQRFSEMGLEMAFSKNVEEIDEFESSRIKSRIADFHAAFENPDVKAVIAVIGGDNSNQLLDYIDWDIIRKNPKIFCGYSDITALNNAIFAKTGLVNYSGAAYATFGVKHGFEITLEYFKKCLFSAEPYEIKPAPKWSDDAWYLDQEKRDFKDNEGCWLINEGTADGTILGGNLCTFNLLQGTVYFPDLQDSILFLEDDLESNAANFNRDLQSLIHQSGFGEVKGIAIGRFQTASNISKEILTRIIKTKKELDRIPVLANVDFGHTQSMATFPIGGEAHLSVKTRWSKLEIIKH